MSHSTQRQGESTEAERTTSDQTERPSTDRPVRPDARRAGHANTDNGTGRHEVDGRAEDADPTTAGGDEEKRSGRRPEGPAHARKGSATQTIKRTLTEFSEDNLTDAAAALTYYAILSIFPALLALVALVGLV